jgi:rubrerythrin
MDVNASLIELIQEQVKIERESVARLAETERKVGTGAARLLLTEMRMDSQKHAGVLEAVLEMLKGTPSKSSWERALNAFVDPILVKKELEYHKGLGNSMQTHILQEMKKTDDEAIRTLLQHLAEDERRHHEILDTIMERCYRIIQ